MTKFANFELDIVENNTGGFGLSWSWHWGTKRNDSDYGEAILDLIEQDKKIGAIPVNSETRKLDFQGRSSLEAYRAGLLREVEVTKLESRQVWRWSGVI
jgi:hypothetical protein